VRTQDGAARPRRRSTCSSSSSPARASGWSASTAATPSYSAGGAEEAEALAAAGIDFEIVPAPTSAIATLAYAGIPVTDRHCASSLAIVTGQSAPGREVHWRGLATAADTIVVLMGTAVLAHIVDELIAGGLDSQTPSAIVENGTTPMQRVIVAPIGDLPARAAEAGVGRRMSSLSER